MDLSPDTMLRGRYRIIQKLGEGGMGAVFLAYDTTLETQVAVKYNRNATSEGSTQFLREARLLASLRHPNLPRVIDYFLADEDQYLVMDYIAGDDLETILKRDGAQPVDTVLNWAEQLASALNYLHKQVPPVIHRDIKPANLKLTPDGEIILVDFGIAKVSETSQATATGATGYTPGFAPPEQYGGGRTGPYSDQYSMAATLYTLLTHQRPVDSVQRMLGQAVLTPLNLLNPAIPASLQAAIERGMAPLPEERFPSMADFAAAIQAPTHQVQMPAAIPAAGAVEAAPPEFSAPTVLARQVAPGASLSSAAVKEAQPAAKRGRISLGVVALVIAGILIVGGGLVAGLGFLAFRGPRLPALATLVSPTSGPAQAAPIVPPTTTLPPAASPTLPVPSATLTQPPVLTSTLAPSATFTTEVTPTPAPRPLGLGKRIVFSSDRGDGKTLQLWTMKVGIDNNGQILSSDLVQLTTDSGDKLYPAWSPEGDKLLYSAQGDTVSGLDIFELDLSKPGSAPLNLTQLKGNDIYPAWSPDGRTIAWTNVGRYVPDAHAIYFMDADGSNRQRISLDFQENQPFWTPSGDYLMYVIFATNHHYLFMRSRQDKYATPEPYDKFTIFGRLGEVSDPTISLDGAAIIYTRSHDGKQQIYSVDTKSHGTKVSPLTPDGATEYDPTWSSDAQYIAFTSERDGNPEIYVMTSVGQLQTNLTNSPGRDLYPAWQP